MYRFPKDLTKRSLWLNALKLTEESVKEHHRVCGCHFPNGDATQTPSLHIGERFASPKKMQAPRGVRASSYSNKRRKFMKVTSGIKRPVNSASVSQSPTSSTSHPITSATLCSSDDHDPCLDAMTLCTPVGEPLLSDYNVHELPSESGESFLSSEAPPPCDV